MAKKIKFPLHMKNGYKVRTLEELQQEGDIKTILEYFHNGKLISWLEDRGYNDILDNMQNLDATTEDGVKLLCHILGVTYQELPNDISNIQEEQEQLNRLKKLTSDEVLLESVDIIAFDQGELNDIYSQNTNIIYLSGDDSQIYDINDEYRNIQYIGLFGNPSVRTSVASLRDLHDKGITFKNVELPESLAQFVRPSVEYVGSNCLSSHEISVNRENAKGLHKIVQDKMFDFVYDEDYRTRKLKLMVEHRLSYARINLNIRTDKLKAVIESKLGGVSL